MSRAFVRESDQDATESLPELAISSHPNFVTRTGLQLIETRIQDLERARQEARAAEDKSATARIARDLRYWTQRRASARVIQPPPQPDAVRFGVKVTLRFEDGTERVFRLVGEDEADPANGLLSWASPLASALMGRTPGEVVDFQSREAEIVQLEA